MTTATSVETAESAYSASVTAYCDARDQHQLVALAYAKALVREAHPTAAKIHLDVSDQSDHGYVLIGVEDKDGNALDEEAVDEEVWAPLSDLNDDYVTPADRGTHAYIDLED